MGDDQNSIKKVSDFFLGMGIDLGLGILFFVLGGLLSKIIPEFTGLFVTYGSLFIFVGLIIKFLSSKRVFLVLGMVTLPVIALGLLFGACYNGFPH